MNIQTRARWITIFATFLAFMGIGVVDPVLPSIAASIGASHWQVELLFTSYIFVMACMMMPAGLLSSRFGDKRLMSAGLLIVTAFALLCSVAGGITELALFRGGWGLGNAMFFATAMTLLIALSKSVETAVGMYEAAIGLGLAGGPLVGGLLGDLSWRAPFFGTSLLMLLAFILVIFFVHPPAPKKAKATAGWQELRHLFTHGPFIKGALAGMFYYYGFFVVLAYSPLILSLTSIQIGLVFFGWGLCLAFGSAVLSRKLETRFAPVKLLPFTLSAFILLLLGLFFVSSSVLMIIFIVLSGLFSGLNNSLFTSHVMENSPYERSISSGAYNFLRWLGAAFAPVMSGLIGNSLSAHLPYLVAGVLGAAALLFIGWSRTDLQTERTEAPKT